MKLYLSEHKIYLHQWYMLEDHSLEDESRVLAFCIEAYYCCIRTKAVRISVAQLHKGEIKYINRGLGAADLEEDKKLFRPADETEVAAHSL